MSIKLTSPILYAGAHVPVDGATLNYPAALEADLVNRNMAVYVGNPANGGMVPVLKNAEVSTSNLLTLMGDSLAANNWAQSSSSYKNTNPYPFAVGNAIGRNRFKVVQNIAVAGVSTPSIIANQLPLLKAYPTKYVYLTGGTNDISIDSSAGDVVAANVIYLIESILALGGIPIWSTIWARNTMSVAKDAHLMWCNDILRSYARNNNVGIFYDGFYITQLPGSATLNSRGVNWKVDNALHPGTLEGYWLGKYMAKVWDAAGVPHCNGMSYGPEDKTTSANNKSNLLTNPAFAGTGGTVSANCLGTMPDNWTISWGTRTGTGVATASIVDVLDPDTGLACAKGINVTISAGTPNANDYIKVEQASGFNTSIAAGDVYSAQAVVDLPSAANAFIYMRGQTNESASWWGTPITPSGGGSNQPFPENTKLYIETQGFPQVALSSAGVFQVWIAYLGASSGNVVISQPRFKSSANPIY